jgi:hypothetical protein
LEKVFNIAEVRLFDLRAAMLEAKGNTDLLKGFKRVRDGRRKLESPTGWSLSFLGFPSMIS